MNYLKLILLIFFFANYTETASSQSKFSYNVYVGEKGDTLRYRQLYPDANSMRKYPLVIFLHGSGERGSDNEAQLKWGVTNFATDQNMALHPCLVIAPQCPEKTSWSNFSRSQKTEETKLQPTPTPTMDLLVGLIRQVMKTMPVDSNRIYITGLSMGGFGTYDAIMRYPDLFAAAVPVCGGGDPSKASVISKIPIWIFHGAEDPSVNPGYSFDMLQALNKEGAHPGYTQYPEVGHFSWIQAYSDPLMIEWLFRQRKN